MPSASILVGDIGSTKSTWRFSADPAGALHLPGYNPVAHDERQAITLFTTLAERTRAQVFNQIWYYGTGVMDHSISGQIRHQMALFFPQSEIHVASDLTGAALATCGHQPGCVAILGTGSHAAVFDGHRFIRQAASLGFILGDEGGGADIGKALIQSYFYQEMPEVIAHEMAKMMPEGREGFLKALKTSDTPNQFLAGFARIAVLFQEHLWIRDLVRSRFKLFVKRHVVALDPDSPVHIVGSIGCIFAGLIREELEITGYQSGIFIKDPALRLYEIHMEHGKTKI